MRDEVVVGSRVHAARGQESYNAYRYNSKRWDAASGTYDMGFRDYSPGLNRFTTRDMRQPGQQRRG
ncbi:RHS repeat-associated core domain-containing protein [Streptomyces sp. AC602_WCS936]|uniref:RHS repeat-associated core domain-containing protein n=1 Tax=Streptomyces sp. AC602_WCS936 TaxID=2823685 RepID=UPI0027E47402|nr:RHS repeat-associated core domain-containing protein [Streptomyces sp. AC602_WCS936]